MTPRFGSDAGERLTFTSGPRTSVSPSRVEPSAPHAAAAPARETAEPKDYAFTALLAFTAVLFLRPQDMFPALDALHLAEMTAGLGLLALVIGRLSRHERISRMTPEFAGVLAFGFVILATAPFSLWPGGSVGVFTELYVKVVLVYLLAVNVVSSPRRLWRLSWVLVLAVSYIGLLAVLDYVRGENLIGHGTRVRGAVGGVMGNANDLALHMVVFLPFALCVAIWPGSIMRRLVAAGCALVMLVAIVASGSRGGFLGLVVMLAVLALVLLWHRPGYVIAAALALMCALPLLPASYWTRIASITDSSKDDTGSREERQILMRESLQAYSENLFVGVGAGEFKDWKNATRAEAWHESHNVWLQVAAELGTVGLVVFAFIVFRAFFSVWQTRRLLRRSGTKRHPEIMTREERALLNAHSAAAAAALAGWFVCAFFASVAYNWTFYYLLALAAIPRDILRDRLPRPVRTGRAWSASRRVALAGAPEART